MQRAFINPDKCVRCGSCNAHHACPKKAIFRIDAEEPSIVEPNICHGCGDCAHMCPAKAVEIRDS